MSHFSLAFICLIWAWHGGHAQTLVHTGHEPDISERHNSETCADTSKDSVKFIQHRVEVGKDMASSSVPKMAIDPLKDGAENHLGDVLPDDRHMEEEDGASQDVLLLLQPRLQPQINTSRAKNSGIVDHQPQVQPSRWYTMWSASLQQRVDSRTNPQEGPYVERSDDPPIPYCGRSGAPPRQCCKNLQEILSRLRSEGYWMSEADEDAWHAKAQREFDRRGFGDCKVTIKQLTHLTHDILMKLHSGRTPNQIKDVSGRSALKPVSRPSDIQIEGSNIRNVRRIDRCTYRPDVMPYNKAATVRHLRKKSFEQFLAERDARRNSDRRVAFSDYVEYYVHGGTSCPECLVEVLDNARQRVQDAVHCWYHLVIDGNLPHEEWEGLKEDLAQDVTNKVLELLNLGGIELDWIKNLPQAELSDFGAGNVDAFGGEVEGIATTLGCLIKNLYGMNLQNPLTAAQEQEIYSGCFGLFSSIAVTVVQYSVKVLDVMGWSEGGKVVNNGAVWKINGHAQDVASGAGAHDWWHAIGRSMGQGQLSESVHMSGEAAALGLGSLVGEGLSIVDQVWLKGQDVTACQLLGSVAKIAVASTFGFPGLVIGGGIALPAAMSGLVNAVVGSPIQTFLVATAVPTAKLATVQIGNLLWRSIGHVVSSVFPNAPPMLKCAAGVKFEGESETYDGDKRVLIHVNWDGGRIRRGGVSEGRIQNHGAASHAKQETWNQWRTPNGGEPTSILKKRRDPDCEPGRDSQGRQPGSGAGPCERCTSGQEQMEATEARKFFCPPGSCRSGSYGMAWNFCGLEVRWKPSQC